MHPQALTILIVYLLSLIVGLIGSIMSKTFNLFTGIGLFFSLLFVVFLTYDTNCLTEGNCGVWSWIRTVLYILFPVISLILLLVGLVTGKSKKTEDTKKV